MGPISMHLTTEQTRYISPVPDKAGLAYKTRSSEMASTSVDNYSRKGHEDIHEVLRQKRTDVSEEAAKPTLYDFA